MKMYQLSEENLFDLLRNSFVAGEEFAENIQDFETGEVEEVTEPDFDDYHASLDLTDYEIKPIVHRLSMIKDDVNALYRFIEENNLLENFNQPSKECSTAITHFNNIKIACNLDDTECLDWKLFNKTDIK